LAAPAIAAVLALPATASASPPTITSATSNDGYLGLTWDLPEGMHNWSIEAATSPTTLTDGAFPESTRILSELIYGRTYNSGGFQTRVVPGTYYVHVSAYGTCANPISPACAKEFSEVKPVTVTPTPPPTLDSVSLNGRHLFASWTLPVGLENDYIEVATNPDVYADGLDRGAFLDENTILLEDPGAQVGYTSSAQLPGGTYYVHLAAFDPLDCPTEEALTCVDKFSQTAPIVVSSRAPTITDAGRRDHHVRVSWTLPPGMLNDYLEIASSPDTYQSGFFRGAFLGQNVRFGDLLDWSDSSYETLVDFPPGTYYLHVADFAPATCPTDDARTCLDEFSPTVAITIPPDPVPAPPQAPPPATPVDRVTAFSSLKSPSKQDIDKLFVRAGMGESGTITVSGSVSVPSLSKVYRLRTVVQTIEPGALFNFRLELPRKGLKAARKAIRHHKRVRAKVTITAQDTAGNLARQRRTIRLTN
jgi:hypothetical protein